MEKDRNKKPVRRKPASSAPKKGGMGEFFQNLKQKVLSFFPKKTESGEEKEKKERKKKPERQSWKPHWMPDAVYKVWLTVFAVFKIAMGAVATVLLIAIVCGFVFLGILGAYLEDDIIPDAEMMKENYNMDQTSFVHYVDGEGNIQKLQQIYATTDREWASIDEIPRDLINAAVAIEDKRFYEHQGVDWITTVKACAGMFFGSGDAGGSTITQQLVKNMTQDDSVTVRRKIVEIFKAQDFERRYDKDTVMEWYLNLIYFGDRKNGVKSAAAHYFGKELRFLSTAECASLISITNNPSIFSPYASEMKYDGKMTTGEERNQIRQINTLWMMRNEGYLTEDAYQAALKDAENMVFKSGIDPEDALALCEKVDEKTQEKTVCFEGTVKDLEVKVDSESGKEQYFCPNCGEQVHAGGSASQEVYSWFVDTVLEDVGRALAEKDGMLWDTMSKAQREVYMHMIQKGGFHIYSTLDMEVQAQVDKIYTDLEQIPDTRGGQQLQSGIVIIDNRTGDIVALAGGVGEKVIFDGYNMATDAKRQVGSALKPLSVYAPAFEAGVITPATVITDLPFQYNEDPATGKITAFPRNSDKLYKYSMTVLEGVEESVNAVAINVLDTIGTRYSYNFLKNHFRINNLVELDANGNTDVAYSPLGLGGLTEGATVRDVASAYATFANDGVYRQGRTFTKVYDSRGKLVIDNTQGSERILKQKTVDYVNYCLRQVVLGGTGTDADMKNVEVFGKTGTTNSRKDRYFCGYTGYYTAAVWCGFELPAEIQLVSGSGNPAVTLWSKVMKPLHEGKENIALMDTNKMVEVSVCLDSGKLATDACSCDVRGDVRTRTVLVYPEDVPVESCDKHVLLQYCYDADGNPVGVANDYCKKFAAVGMTKLENKALVKLTAEEIEALLAAEEFNLQEMFLDNGYVYLVDEFGEPTPFYGFKEDINEGLMDNCVGCHIHTQETWEDYYIKNPWVDYPFWSEPWPVDPPPEDPYEPPLEIPTEPPENYLGDEE